MNLDATTPWAAEEYSADRAERDAVSKLTCARLVFAGTEESIRR